MSEMQYVCPKCGRDDALSVVVSTMAKLTQYRDGTDNIETEADGDHEWEGTRPELYSLAQGRIYGPESYSKIEKEAT